MTQHALRLVVFSWLSCALAVPAAAQQDGANPADTARIQIGPLGITPTVGVTNLGIDSNVFNEAVDPKRDVTATFSPGGNAWLRAGPTLLAIDGRADLVHFQTYASERSVDGSVGGHFAVRGNRLTPWVGTRYTSARQPVGYEIDLRSRRIERRMSAGLDVRVLARTHVGISAQRAQHSYDADARFFGASLQETLNRRSDSADVSLSYHLTPLTTFRLEARAIRDRFAFSPLRDADSRRLVAGFDLSPSALISGSGRAGYRTFDGSEGGAPDFSGFVASVDASYTFQGRTRFEVNAERDLNYSFEITQPYYVITGGQLVVTPRLSTHWDLQARAGAQQLAYRELSAAASRATRVDHFTTYGAGIGYRLADTRVGVNLDREHRDSPAAGRSYNAYRMGVSVTYGR